jgi:protein-L-isoaspartate(D-aspartate) O-methyltransferase
MLDFATARRMMVDGQVRTADVTDLRLIAAMMEVPRERFVADEKAALAYLDLDLPIGEGGRAPRRLLKPMVLAKLIQLAGISETDRVLDVGCGTGYAAAVLSRLAANVVVLDEDGALARRAGTALTAVGATNVKVVSGRLAEGWPAEAPYDAILVEGATEVVPEPLLRQLRSGGRLVCVMGAGPAGKATLYRRVEGEFSGRPAFEATAALLPGFGKQPTFVF